MQSMNVCREDAGLFYCPECLIYVKDGVIKTADVNGEFQKPLGHTKPDLKLVDKVSGKEVPEEKPEPQNIDVYFSNGDKKCFRNVIGLKPREGWIVLTKVNGAEVVINAQNVNYMDEI